MWFLRIYLWKFSFPYFLIFFICFLILTSTENLSKIAAGKVSRIFFIVHKYHK